MFNLNWANTINNNILMDNYLNKMINYYSIYIYFTLFSHITIKTWNHWTFWKIFRKDNMDIFNLAKYIKTSSTKKWSSY